MNPIEIGIKIEEAVRCRPPQKGKRYQLCFHQGRVWCHPLGLLTYHHHVIAVFTDDDLQKGFTSEQWDQMARRIYSITESEKERIQDAKDP